MPTNISWVNNPDGTKGETLNVNAGCTKCSPGCRYCYAEQWSMRLKAMGQPAYQDVVDHTGWTGVVTCRPDQLEKVKHWRKEQLVFVNSMSDLFHPDVPFEFIDKVMIVIKKYPQHTFKILTKRVKRMAQFFSAWQDYPYPDNIHHGVSICTQSEADEKIPILLSIPSAFRFVSFEPLLEYIDIVKKPWYGDWDAYNAIGWLEQIIIGCERRISNVAGQGQDVFIEAAESLIEQADKADVKVHVKQVPIDGKVETDIKKFPKELQRRDTP